MSLARLHRRLVSGMSLAALLAFAAGAGWTPDVVAAALALVVSLVWLPPARASAWLESAARVIVVVLCAWMFYVAFALGGDFMPAVLAMLLFLLATESLRALEAANDMRLYSLSFALLIAATAFYPGLGFAAAFAAYVALATLAMMVGYLRRQGERFRVADMRVGRRFLWTTAGLSGVTLLMSGALFVVFPRLPRQWSVHGRAGADGATMAGFGDRVSLGEHGGRIEGNPEVAFRVEFPDGPPPAPQLLYWRGRSFDAFDGTEWSRSRGVRPTGLSARGYARRWGGPYRRARVFGGPPGAGVLFGPHPVTGVQASSAIRPIREGTGDLLFVGSDVPVYTVTWAARPPADATLRVAEGGDDPDLRPYLQLPRLSPAVRALADSLTLAAPTRLDAARALEAYFHREFRYTLDLPATRADATVEGFLFRRRAGHCEYFSTAMVVLLRARGIPARNVTGFLGGQWNPNGGYLAVTGNEAHSWVEVWFPGLGWVPFEPTPPGRSDAIRREGGSLAWRALFWLDGIEYRWYKWVVDYNLEKQLAVFQNVGSLFSRDPASRGGTGTVPRGPLAWTLVGAAGAGALLWLARGRRTVRVTAETRAYLGVRRAYARAGWASEDGGGPLEFAERLEREGAPGAADARRVVDLYLRARFAGRPPGEDERAELEASAREARDAVRQAPRERVRGRRPAGV